MFGPLFQAADAIDKIMRAIEQIKEGNPKAREGILSALESLYSTIPGFGQLKGAAGWLQGGNPLPGFASGGIASGPASGYPVMLHGTERITPLGAGAGGSSVHVHIGTVVGTDEAAARKLAEMVGRHLSRGVMRQMVGQNA